MCGVCGDAMNVVTAAASLFSWLARIRVLRVRVRVCRWLVRVACACACGEWRVACAPPACAGGLSEWRVAVACGMLSARVNIMHEVAGWQDRSSDHGYM